MKREQVCFATDAFAPRHAHPIAASVASGDLLAMTALFDRNGSPNDPIATEVPADVEAGRTQRTQRAEGELGGAAAKRSLVCEPSRVAAAPRSLDERKDDGPDGRRRTVSARHSRADRDIPWPTLHAGSARMCT